MAGLIQMTHTQHEKQYDCGLCPSYCCSYPVIVLSKRDMVRIAKFHHMELETAERKFTRKAHGYKRIMRRKRDEHFGRICRFIDSGTRACTIYKARPATCRTFPGTRRCGYYDFLAFERDGQNDPEYISTTWHHED